MQASGEAEFTTDIPTVPNEVAAAFVLTTKVWLQSCWCFFIANFCLQSNVVITKIDSSVAEVSDR